MSCTLIVAGAVLQGAGLICVFAELASIRSHEFGEPTPLARVTSWVRRRLKRPVTVKVGGATATARGGRVRPVMRPANVAEDATETQRIARLEKYVALIDDDLSTLNRWIDSTADQAAAEVKSEIDSELERRDSERHEQLRHSIKLQAVGGLLVLVGLILSTIGSLS